MTRLIAGQAIGNEMREYAESARDDLAAAFAADVIIAEPIALPPQAYERDRGQYRARDLLEALAIHQDPRWSRLLGVADVDLDAGGLNCVFGRADRARGLAVLSRARLLRDERAGWFNRSVRQRVPTEA